MLAVNDIRKLRSLKLSHSVRHCFIRAQNERGETDFVTWRMTISGGRSSRPGTKEAVLVA